MIIEYEINTGGGYILVSRSERSSDSAEGTTKGIFAPELVKCIISDMRYLKEYKSTYDQSIKSLKDTLVESIRDGNTYEDIKSLVNDIMSSYDYSNDFSVSIRITYHDYHYDISINPNDSILNSFSRIDARLIPAILDINMSDIETELINNEFDTNEVNDIMLKLYKLISYINHNVSEYYC